MKKRMIAAILTVLLLLPVVPTNAEAVQTREMKMKDTIVVTYYRALRRTGRKSFLGYCGSCVNNQIYLMGITDKVVGCNGNDVYNRYSVMGTTSGGYPTRAYYGTSYSLRSALNTISENGTRDVYNIAVGFQKTNTVAGSKYGHAVFIYAIMDGIVYFAECCAIMLNGVYYPENSAVTCSIDAFCSYYEPWTTFEGVVWFGNKTYAEQCHQYDATMTGMVMKPVDVLSDIPGPEEYKEPETLEKLFPGEILTVTGLMETPDGEYWYEVDRAGNTGYIPTNVMKDLAVLPEAACKQTVNILMPSYLRQGRWFHLYGEAHAGAGSFSRVRITLQKENSEELLHDIVENVDAKYVNIEGMDSQIQWHKLPEGDYILSVYATVEGLYVKNGALETKQQEIQIWNSEFHVQGNSTKLPQITFHSCGGEVEMDRTYAVKGEELGGYPIAERQGYLFCGWYTDSEGGEMVTSNTIVTGDMELYAHWRVGYPGYTGWLQTEQGWNYYRKGEIAQGWFYYNGKKFYQNEDGTSPEGWTYLDGKIYYFSKFGAMVTGWVTTNQGTYFLKHDGTKFSGDITIRGVDYYFNEAGLLSGQ